jgi:hypothetical protein
MAKRMKANIKAHAVDHTPQRHRSKCCCRHYPRRNPFRNWQLKRVLQTTTGGLSVLTLNGFDVIDRLQIQEKMARL